MKQLPTKEYWKRQSSDKFEDVKQEASFRIFNILKLTGTHNYELEMLDMYCGLGATVQKLRGGGFEHIIGIDPDEEVEQYWDRENCLQVLDPLDSGYDYNSFDLVTCFGGFSRTSDHSKLLEEMKRITRRYIMFKPFDDGGLAIKKDIIPLFMKHRLIMTDINQVHGYYTLKKEKT